MSNRNYNHSNTHDLKRRFKQLSKNKYGLPIAIILIIIAIGSIFSDDLSQESNQPFDNIASNERYTVEVDRFIDGDTVQLYFNGSSERFRMITVDAPELDHENGNHEAYAEEAADRLKSILLNANSIEVEFDDHETQDQYGRYLAYIFADDENLNVLLTREGLTQVRYTNTDNKRYYNEMIDAENEAKQENIGIWSN